MSSPSSPAPFALLLCLLGPLVAQAPRFVDASPGELTCKVKRTAPMAKGNRSPGTFLHVEVRNPTKHHAEPNGFKVVVDRDADGQPVPALTTWRYPAGTHGRHGRAVPPGGKEVYMLQVERRLGPRSKVGVTVAEASFFDGAPLPRPAVSAGAVRTEGYMFGNVNPIRTWRTTCRIANPLDHPLDVTFLATCDKPFDGAALVRTRLDAREQREWTIEEVEYSDGRSFTGLGAQRLKLVDWSAVAAPDADLAATILRETFGQWHRWPDGTRALSGTFELEVVVDRHADAPAGSSTAPGFRGRGTFRVGGAGDVVIDAKALDDGQRAAAAQVIRRALDDVLRPPVEEFLKNNRLRLARGGDSPRIAFHGTGWDWRSANRAADWIPTLTLDGRRMIESAVESRPVPPVRWSTRELGAGFVVTRRAGEQYDRRWEYGEAAGVVVPLVYTEIETAPRLEVRTSRVRLADWLHIDPGAVAEPVDAGPAATELRAAWDASYRYPAAGADLRGSVRVECRPDTAQLWEGERKLAGTFVVEGYRGSRYARAEVKLAGRMDEAKKRRVGEIVVDRFRIWYNRDFNDRPPFERQFAGARITAGGAGVFGIDRGPYRELHVRDGLIRTLVFRSGLVRELSYTKVGSHQVVTRMTAGDEVVAARYRAFGEFLVPVEMRFEKVFGRDWGPETLKFDRVEVTPR